MLDNTPAPPSKARITPSERSAAVTGTVSARGPELVSHVLIFGIRVLGLNHLSLIDAPGHSTRTHPSVR